MYQALYRKYRPLLFKDVVGQASIVKVLKNSIINNHVGHAYMFFGPRGTGKTSLAKIFSRTINCENVTDGEICGKCSSCSNMLQNKSVDIIEIDAASNNGVDEIRELKSKINLVPNQLKYKVYIIDEVHMLSIGAFNALLKTLEEPPEHIVFILATTDPQKVPETIKSRCQCFSFKRVSNDDIIKKMVSICSEENISIDNKILKNIAISSNGGLRDSLSMLDMLYSSCGKKITIDDYVEMNDLISEEELSELFYQICNGDVEHFLIHIEKIYSCGKNIIQICESLLQLGRDIIVNYYCNDSMLDINYAIVEKIIFLLNDELFNLKKASNPKIYVEVMILKFISENIFEGKKNNEIISREIILEQKFDNLNKEIPLAEQQNFSVHSKLDENSVGNNENVMNVNDSKNDFQVFDNNDFYDKIESDFLEKYKEIMDIRVNNTLFGADKSILNQVKEKFTLLNEYVFDQKIGYLVCSLMDGVVRAASSDCIIISLEYDSMIDANLKRMEHLVSVFHQITGLTQSLAFITDAVWNKKKQEYIEKIRNGENYSYVVEPSLPVLKKKEKRDKLVSSAIELFGDIVEEE